VNVKMPGGSVGIVKRCPFMLLHELMQGGQDAAGFRRECVHRKATGVRVMHAFYHAAQFVAQLL